MHHKDRIFSNAKFCLCDAYIIFYYSKQILRNISKSVSCIQINSTNLKYTSDSKKKTKNKKTQGALTLGPTPETLEPCQTPDCVPLEQQRPLC